MKATNAGEIQKSFAKQAAAFETEGMNFSKQEYLQWAADCIAPRRQDRVLEVAAGTCAMGRAVAPHAAQVSCLDLTLAMLEVGRRKAAEQGLDNMDFIIGDAQELPYPEGCFDIVMTRLAFHHFPDIHRPFAEMARVLRPHGKLVLLDMEAAPEELRNARDEMEKMRDPSHIRNLSGAEAEGLFQESGIPIFKREQRRIPVSLAAWMQLTGTPQEAQEEIVRRMAAEVDGGERTGFFPYQSGGEFFFTQNWMLFIGEKPERESGCKGML